MQSPRVCHNRVVPTPRLKGQEEEGEGDTGPWKETG